MLTLCANTCRTKPKKKNNIGTGKDGGRVRRLQEMRQRLQDGGAGRKTASGDGRSARGIPSRG